jgi:hypothetical protein
MSITIVATPGAADANSYATLDEAASYFEVRLHDEAWESAATEDQKAALVWATRLIDGFDPCPDLPSTLGPWTGTVSSATQALAWPRTGMTDSNGRAIASTVIPNQLKWAEFEQALALLKADRTLESAAGAQGITRLKAGSVELGFKDEITIQSIAPGVRALLPRSWVRQCSGITSYLFDVVGPSKPCG